MQPLKIDDLGKISKEIGRLRRIRANSITLAIHNLWVPVYNVDTVDDVIKRYWTIYLNV
jgi:hypothetical protein